MDFYKRVSVVCKGIPFGKVATYGQIAMLCGKPRNARQVGYALHKKIKEDRVPTHRVVNGQGYLTGAQAFENSDVQGLLLEQEGVEVSGEKRVDLKEFGWKNTMEEALMFREYFEKNNI